MDGIQRVGSQLARDRALGIDFVASWESALRTSSAEDAQALESTREAWQSTYERSARPASRYGARSRACLLKTTGVGQDLGDGARLLG